MGNINNIWYLKDSGGDWASTKCELDDCYSIPYDSGLDDKLYLQADIPEGYGVQEVWLADPAGNRVQEILQMTEWKIITGEGINRLIFKVPQISYACKGVPKEEEICVASLYGELLPPYYTGLINNYVNGLHHTVIYLFYNGVYYNIDGPLPPQIVRVNTTEFQIPCDMTPGSLHLQIYSDVGNAWQSWPSYDIEVQTRTVYEPFDCFRFEVPLIPTGEGSPAVLVSEPFHCPMCEPTLKISSDYCLSKTDIFGELILDTEGFGETHYGGLATASNDMRIQAVLRQQPSKLSASRNLRCNNFKSAIQQRYKLQGAMPTDFPDYMVRIVESIFSGKKIYIEGEEYIPEGDSIFTERNIAGRSMKRLEVALVKCEKALVYDCKCVVEVPNCEDNPLEYYGIMFCTTAPDQGYGVDRSIWRFSIDPTGITGGAPPYTISNWQAYICEGTITPHDAFSQTWSDSSHSNFYRRGGSYNGDCREWEGVVAGCSCLSVLATITDARGCKKIVGNTVDVDDLRCVEQAGDIVLGSIGTITITIANITPFAPGATFDITFDGTNYPITGVNSLPYTITGLTPQTEYRVKIRINCSGGMRGYVGPVVVETV